MRKVVRKAAKPLQLIKPNKLTSPSLALKTVTSKSGLGVYASSDVIFKGAVFGRDSLEVAEDLIYIRPKLVVRILKVIAGFQGEVINTARDEEPGKIHHEYRNIVVDGKKIDDETLQVFHKYSYRWGGDDKTMTYYGSSDATPLFIRVLAKFCSIYGDEILLERINLRSGHNISMLEVLENAVNWLTRHLKNSKTGLLEYHRANPSGLANQVWKDSLEFYVHENGDLANHNMPITSVELQGLAYDALVMASELLPSSAKKWGKIAEKLRSKTLNMLWDEENNYFYLGLDFDEDGKKRVFTPLTANPAELLDSRFFDGLPSDQKHKYVSGLVNMIMSDEFLTDAGIRSRGLRESYLVPFWDYHGSFTSWPKETYDISKGLARHGFYRLSKELDNRLINTCKVAHGYPEFFYVDKRGRVLGASQSAHGHDELAFVDSPIRPEKVQAWTVSAFISIQHKNKQKNVRYRPEEWQKKLESEILATIPHMPLLNSSKELSARYPAYNYRLADRERD